jgi:hypothetical protein
MGKRGIILDLLSSNGEKYKLSDDEASTALSVRAHSLKHSKIVQTKTSTNKNMQNKGFSKASDAANRTLTLLAAVKKSLVCAKKFNVRNRTICWSWSH